MAKSRAWVFTLNNPKPGQEDEVQENVMDSKYATYGREVGSAGTPHLQGYVYWANARALSAVRARFAGAHVEPAKGTPAQAAAYCHKEDPNPWTFGELPGAGKRSDLAAVRVLLKEKGSMREVAEVATSFQAIRGGELLLKYIEPRRTWKPTVRWYWGPTGSGKTRRACEEAGEDRWMSGRSLQWWDGYDGHTKIILDDFRGDFCPFHTLLRYLDRYECRVEVKGGSRQLLARDIWITSCSSPDKVYPGCSERVDQLLRRIDIVVELRDVSGCTTLTQPDTEVQGNNRSDVTCTPARA